MRKIGRVIVLTIITAVILLNGFSSNSQINIVEAATDINSSIITSDTTWTKANSPYTLNGPIRIERGVTLTVEPGAVVNLNHKRIEVWGSLLATGNSGDRVYLSNGLIKFQADAPGTNNNAAKSPDSQIKKTTLNSIQLEINYSSPVIAESELTDCGLIASKSSLILENNIVTFSYQASISSSSALVKNNIIKCKPYEPIWTAFDASTFSNNTFISSSINADGSTFLKNIFYGAGVTAVSNVRIEQNVFINSNLGINVKGINNEIKYNTIVNNTVGIAFNHGATFAFNNIYGNSQYNARIGGDAAGDYTLTLANNWWGTTDEQAISRTIYDNKNDYNLPRVEFTPYLTEPNSQAPTIPKDIFGLEVSPTPSPTISPTPTVPEFSWIAILPLFIVVLSVALVLKNRKTANLSK